MIGFYNTAEKWAHGLLCGVLGAIVGAISTLHLVTPLIGVAVAATLAPVSCYEASLKSQQSVLVLGNDSSPSVGPVISNNLMLCFRKLEEQK